MLHSYCVMVKNIYVSCHCCVFCSNPVTFNLKHYSVYIFSSCYYNSLRLKEIATEDQIQQMESYFPKKYFPNWDDPTKDPLRDHCDVIIEELGELIGMIRCTKCITHRINKLNMAHTELGMSEECRHVSIQCHNILFSLTRRLSVPFS